MLVLLLSTRYHSYGDSGQLVSRTVDGDGEGSVYAVRYDMGNVSLGYVHTETSYKEGTNAAASTGEHGHFWFRLQLRRWSSV